MKKVNSKKNTNLIHHFVVPLLQQRRLTSSTTSWSPFSNREGKAGNRRGFTIVELVVAMVIIVIVSGAGISLVMTQTKVDSQATQTVDATNICENAIECFRYAVNNPGEGVEETFKEAFNRTLADDEKLGDPDAETGKYTINKGGAVIEITITEDTVNSTYTIDIYAVDSFDVTIFDGSYTK